MAAPMCRAVREKSQNFLRFLVFNRPFYTVKCYCIDTRKLHNSDNSPSKSLFWQDIHARKDQASRSILVRLSGRTSEESLLQYCTSHGKVQHCFTYSQQQQRERYALVEFKTSDGIDLILERALNGHVQSRFLSFSGSSQGSDKVTTSQCPQVNKDISFAELYKDLAVAESVSEQLGVLTSKLELRDPETRLRFLVCSLIEEAFHRILPHCTLHLFGSSVNSFGRRSCDMDMFLERNTEQGVVPLKKGKGQYQLGYDRPSAESERAAAQATLFALASFLEKQIPHCVGVARILRAKCPLVKFRHYATGLSCDLTADNSIALKSSELLYIYSQLDARVRPLVFMIRQWARHHGITNRTPGYWITNFPLTLLVVFFLQTRTQPVVPSFEYLRSLADESDTCVIDGTDCTTPGDLSKAEPSQNTQTTAELLQEFFSFCATFDFESNALSVRAGQPSPKPDRFSPLHMENPFQTQLNLCKNVSEGLLKEIQKHSQYALQMMDVPGFHGPGSASGSEVIHPWGIGALLAPLKIRRNGKRSAWDNSNVGDVLRGLSRKTPKAPKTEKKPLRGDTNENNSAVAGSSASPNPRDFGVNKEEQPGARTVHVENVTALDASVQADRILSPTDEDGTWKVRQLDAVRLSQIARESCGPTTPCGQDAARTQSDVARKTQTPKLQITVDRVRRRLFDGRHRNSIKGIVH